MLCSKWFISDEWGHQDTHKEFQRGHEQKKGRIKLYLALINLEERILESNAIVYLTKVY